MLKYSAIVFSDWRGGNEVKRLLVRLAMVDYVVDELHEGEISLELLAVTNFLLM